MPALRKLQIKFSRRIFPVETEYWTADESPWLKPLRLFKNLKIFEVYIPLMRTQRLPRAADIGACQLFAVDAYGTPYRDYDLEA